MSAVKLPRRIPDGAVHSVVGEPGDIPAIRGRFMGGYEVDRRFVAENIAEALAELGIESPIAVRLTAGRRTAATHRRMADGVHRITLSHHFSAERMSRSLWHELQHAAQSEKHGHEEFLKQYAAFNRYLRYERNPFEREARNASYNHDRLPLVV